MRSIERGTHTEEKDPKAIKTYSSSALSGDAATISILQKTSTLLLPFILFYTDDDPPMCVPIQKSKVRKLLTTPLIIHSLKKVKKHPTC